MVYRARAAPACDRGADGVTLAFVAEMPNAHSNRIDSVAFSPDGTKIVSASYDGSIKLWGVLPCTHASCTCCVVLWIGGEESCCAHAHDALCACVAQMVQHWRLWWRCVMRTAAPFTPWPSHRMAPRSCLPHPTKASSCGVCCPAGTQAALVEWGCGRMVRWRMCCAVTYCCVRACAAQMVQT